MFIKNRFGRVVSVTEERGNQMIAKGEATLFDEVKEPVKKEEGRNPLLCPYCDFIAKSEAGLKTHMRSCKKKAL